MKQKQTPLWKRIWGWLSNPSSRMTERSTHARPSEVDDADRYNPETGLRLSLPVCLPSAESGYRCVICCKGKMGSEMHVVGNTPEACEKYSCCKNCWHMTGEEPFFSCYLCYESSPYHKMIRLTSKYWLCEPCDTKTSMIKCPACGSHTNRKTVQWDSDGAPLCHDCFIQRGGREKRPIRHG